MHIATILVALVATSILGSGSAEAAFPGGNGRIVYVKWGREGNVLVTRTPSGGGRTVLRGPSDEGCVGNPAWRPDGRSLVVDCGFDERPGLATMRGDGSGFLRLPLVSQAEGPGVYYASDSQPAWSPDGGRLAFVSETRYDDGLLSYRSRRLAVMNADGSEPRGVIGARIDDPERTNPEWSSRGLIAFTRWPGWAPCEEATCGPRFRAAPEIWIIRPDGSGLRRVVARAQQPAWSPDGRRIVFVRSPGGLALPETRIYVTGLDGEGVRTVAHGYYPAWSPNGKRIAFVQSRPRRDDWRLSYSIYTVRLDGSDRRLVARSSRHDLGPLDWQPLR